MHDFIYNLLFKLHKPIDKKLITEHPHGVGVRSFSQTTSSGGSIIFLSRSASILSTTLYDRSFLKLTELDSATGRQ